MKKYSSLVFCSTARIIFLHLINTVHCLLWELSTIFFLFLFFFFFQKPKQKDWHPPGGFILGLWALIIMVFFKTYGIKHMKHVFWTGANKTLALAATLGSWVSPVFSACGCVETLCLHLPSKGSFEAISSAPFSGKILTNGFNVTAISLCLDLNLF